MSLTRKFTLRSAIAASTLAILSTVTQILSLIPTANGRPFKPSKSVLSFHRADRKLAPGSSVGWDGPGRGGAALCYHIGDIPDHLDRKAVDSAIESALSVWTSVAHISFTRTVLPHQPRSIDFRFGKIDGPGGTLAHAYLPYDVNAEPTSGDVEFDSSETWEVGDDYRYAAYDLVYCAVHEIGHALGLDHSNKPGSVMAPTVSLDRCFQRLEQADVDAILRLYAPARNAGVPQP
jgi:hypothetical protein